MNTNNNSGFVAIFMIGILPFLLTLLLVSFQFVIIIKQKSYILNVCRETVLKTQNIMLSGINELFKLNPRADHLITEKNRLEIQLAATPDPKLRAAIKLQIWKIKLEQAALGNSQLSLILKINTQANLEINKFQSQLSNKELVTWNSQQPILVRSKANKPSLKIEKIYKNEVASPYREKSNFMADQRVLLNLNYRSADFLFKGFNSLLPTHIKFKEKCESLPYKRRQQWLARLN